MIRVALTGHRPERLGLPLDEDDAAWDNITEWLIKTAHKLALQYNGINCICGMANGSDIKWGIVSSYLNNNFKEMIEYKCKLTCVLPCKNYNSKNKYYEYIKQYANEWIELSDKFYKGCDDVRDQYMVDNCDVLIAIWDGIKSGGVWSTIRKAQKAGKEIIYIPKEILEK